MVDVFDKGKKPKGKHPDKRLSSVAVRQTTVPGRYCDGGGLYLVVEESGAKRWQFRATIAGKRTEVGLGGLTTVSLGEAREEALRLRKLVRAGGNPLIDRRQRRRVVPTFETAATALHKEHAKTFRNPKHAAQWLQSLKNDVFPVIGRKPVDLVDTSDVLKVLTPIWTAKPETSRRIRQRVRVVLDWAKASGFRAGDNPTDGITKVLPKHRAEKAHHAALAFAQVPGFVHELRETDASVITKSAFEFLILTAARTSEVLAAEWTEFDVAAKLWTVPAARIKAGREHRVPLSPRCLELLKKVKRLGDGGPYVFPGRSLLKPLSNMVFLKTLERMHRDDITAHGFRSAFRDWSAERTNFPRAVCEAALAHVVKGVEGAYLRTAFVEQRRELMSNWATFVTSKPAKVVKLRA